MTTESLLVRIFHALEDAAASVPTIAVAHDGYSLWVSYLSENGEMLAGESLTEPSVSVEVGDDRLRAWAKAFVERQSKDRAGSLLGSWWVALTARPDAELARLVEDEELWLCLEQEHEPSWWDACETDEDRAFQAASMGNFHVLERLLDADPELATSTNEHGDTLLHVAVERCDEYSAKTFARTVSLLLDRGADVNAANEVGTTPLHAARAAMIPLLVARGAQLEARDANGMTPLLGWSTDAYGLECMRALLDAGADREARDAQGMRAIDWARARGEEDKVDLLS